ncbi:STAS-like domain-containing protein [Staphylococcus equorum]|uniref:STAS-like domain-containing protein n=1 Tax=Staphylococcus equorum TaxID=246432 RepID=UPI003D808864
MVKTVKVSDLVNTFVTNEQGDIVFREIEKVIIENGKVAISMDGVEVLTSSFLNSSLVPLTDIYDFDWFKKNVKIIEGKAHVIKMIKDRISFAYNHKLVTN